MEYLPFFADLWGAIILFLLEVLEKQPLYKWEQQPTSCCEGAIMKFSEHALILAKSTNSVIASS